MTDSFTKKSPSSAMFQGVLLIALGILAILFPLFASIAIEQVFAAFLLITGGYSLASSIEKKENSMIHRIVSALWALLTLVTGALLLFGISAGLLTLTLLLASYFAAQGIITILASFKFTGTSTMWVMLASGFVSLLLAGMIFGGFPSSAGWILGLLFGINMIFMGTFFISMSSALKARAAQS